MAKAAEETERKKAQEQRAKKKQEAESKIKEHEDFEQGPIAELVKKNDTAGLTAKNLTLKSAKTEQEKLLNESKEARVEIEKVEEEEKAVEEEERRKAEE